MHCEMVGDEYNRDIVARVSIVNKFGECVYDKYVKPTRPVAYYRKWWVNGIRPRDLQNGESFETVQKEVAEIIEGKLLVGHSIINDLKVLFLSHPQRMIRDTQSFSLFQSVMNNKRPNLKELASCFLGIQIQEGKHSSVEDAKATMQLYLKFQKQWEEELSTMRLLTKQVAMDCEMVGDEDNREIVARVSIVNKFGKCVYDKYVKPTRPVADYRTWVSGIRPRNLQNGESFETVQKEVAEIIEGKLLVGHDIGKDLKVLFLSHPQRMIRDTQSFSLFQAVMNNKRPSLKKLAYYFLRIQIQEGEHCSVEDAKATMQLYLKFQKQWEEELSTMRLLAKQLAMDYEMVAMDCEMVGSADNRDIVARVSIVNKFGECVYDKYVKPTRPVADYRTPISGIRPRNLQNGESFETVQKEVAEIIEGKLLVGHSIINDLKVLFLSHPQSMIRDTQSFSLFQTVMNNKRPSLKKLASHFLGIQIQEGEHSSIEDAKTTMQLYLMFQKRWETIMTRLYS